MVEHRDPGVRPGVNVARQAQHAGLREDVFVRHHLPFVCFADPRQHLAGAAPRYARPVLRGIEAPNGERAPGQAALAVPAIPPPSVLPPESDLARPDAARSHPATLSTMVNPAATNARR